MLTSLLSEMSSHFLLDWLFPPRCVSCGRGGSQFCESCLARIAFITPPLCHRCGYPKAEGSPSLCRHCARESLAALDGIRAAAFFEDNPIRPAIHAFKYRTQKVITSILGAILADAYDRFQLTADVLVPVPLHPGRLRERGYNQSELLARELGRRLGLPVNSDTLHRTRETRIQMTLGADERHRNVAQAFSCLTPALAGQAVLLIDDVCTTGSTLDACATALKEAQSASVWGLALARAR